MLSKYMYKPIISTLQKTFSFFDRYTVLPVRTSMPPSY